MATTLPTINPLPTPQGMTNPDGKPSSAFYQFLQSLTQGANAALSGVGTVSGQAEGDTFSISFPSNMTYPVKQNSSFGFTITSITSKSNSGSCSAEFRIGGTPLGGGANFVATTQQVRTHSSANVVDVGSDITCVISGNSGCQFAIFEIAYTRT